MASAKGLLLLTLLLAAAFLVAGADEQTQAKKGDMEAGLPRGRGYRRGGASGADAHGSGCLFRCCGIAQGRRCRCCANADEIPEPMYRAKAQVHN